MIINELSKDEIKELMAKNKWLEDKVYECAYEDAMWAQSEEYKLIGAEAFDYHDHYSSFYLTTPTFYGAKAPEKVAGKLDAEYLSEEDAKLYKELCELNAKMEDAEEWDEDREEYKRMTEIADTLAEHLTTYFRGFEDITDEQIDQVIDDMIEGYNWLGELEVEDGKIKEVIYHD
jgi:hypothetical protein